MVVIAIFLLAICSFIQEGVALEDGIQVTIDQGTLKGIQLTSESGFTYYGFRGIPYAQPPVGDLRFKPPQSPPSWEGTRDATEEGPQCLQTMMMGQGVNGDEDCLYLNIYTPKLPQNDEKLNISVMFFIHGGGWTGGSGSSEMQSPEYLVEQEVIFVALNYRLGALGFLGLNHSEFSKNNGLRDQVAALQWVKNNIERYGGNPESVTIFGQSAGAMSVNYHVLSPASEGLFQRAISESGSALDSESFIDPLTANERAFALGSALGYNTTDPAELLQLLQDTDSNVLLEKQGSAYAQIDLDHGSRAIIYLPTVEYGDNVFLPDYPVNIAESGKFNQVPYIIGVNSREGKMFGVEISQEPSRISTLVDHFEWYVPYNLGLELGSPESVAAANEIKKVYFGDNTLSEDNINQEILDGAANLDGDINIVNGVHRSIKIQSQTGTAPLYAYVFSYVGELSDSQQSNDIVSGAAHGDELNYIFKTQKPGPGTNNVDNNSTEMETVRRMTKIWTNFAKSLDPTNGLEVTWNPVTKDTYTYLNIDTDLTIEDINNFEKERMEMWDSLYKDIDSV